MHTGITSKEAIMQVCREIVAEKGLKALNMRLVADKCHIALGTLYNYYSDKDELMVATVESVWRDIFHMNQQCETDFSFPEYVQYIFTCIQTGAEAYPNFFTEHTVSIAGSKKGEARNTMGNYFAHIKKGMLDVLEADDSVDENSFSESFTAAGFVDFVMDNLLLLLLQGITDCSTLLVIIRRMIYPV